MPQYVQTTKKSEIKGMLSSGLESYFETKKVPADRDLYQYYSMSQYLDGKIDEDAFKKNLENLNPSSAEVDDASAWLSTLDEKDNPYVLSQEEIDKGISDETGKIDYKMLSNKTGVPAKELEKYEGMSVLEREENPYFKTDLRKIKNQKYDVSSLDKTGDTVKIADGSISLLKNGNYQCKSKYLGTFEYDPEMWQISYKELNEKDGSKSQLPILEYIGKEDGSSGYLSFIADQDFDVPKGVKSLDYTFTGNKNLKVLPDWDSSLDTLETMHYAFAGCKNVDCGDLWDMGFHWPHKIKDLSYTFENCSSMQTGGFFEGGTKYASFEDLPKSVVNIRGIFSGCTHIAEYSDHFLTHMNSALTGANDTFEYGGLKNPYLSAFMAKYAVDGVAKEAQKETTDNTKYLIDEYGRLDEKVVKDLKKEAETDHDEKTSADNVEKQVNVIKKSKEFAEARVGTATASANDFSKDAVTLIETKSKGNRTRNTYYDASTDAYFEDETGLMKSDDKENVAWWQRYAVDGAAGLGIGLLVGKVTGSEWGGLIAGVGGAVGLDYMDILPESLSPILTKAADMFGKESGIGKQLQDWANKLSGSTVEEQREKLTSDFVAENYVLKDDHITNALEKGLLRTGVIDDSEVNACMKNNGEYCAQKMLFEQVGLHSKDALCTTNISKLVGGELKNVTTDWDEKTDKTKMQDYYLSLFEGLDSYDKGAEKGIRNTNFTSDVYDDDKVRSLSHKGLALVNGAYLGKVVSSMDKMDEKYHFMDDEMKKKLSTYSFSGIGSLDDYRRITDKQKDPLSAIEQHVDAVQKKETKAKEEKEAKEAMEVKEAKEAMEAKQAASNMKDSKPETEMNQVKAEDVGKATDKTSVGKNKETKTLPSSSDTKEKGQEASGKRKTSRADIQIPLSSENETEPSYEF